jgi:hypothetical protein
VGKGKVRKSNNPGESKKEETKGRETMLSYSLIIKIKIH